MSSFSLPAARVELSLIRGVFDDHLVIGGAQLDWRQVQGADMRRRPRPRERIRQRLYESHALKSDADRARASDWLIAADDPRRLALADYVEQTESHFEVVSARWLARAARLDPALFSTGISISLDFAFEGLGDLNETVIDPHCLTLAAGAGPDDFSHSWYCRIGRQVGKIAAPHSDPTFSIAAAELDEVLRDEIETYLDGLDEDFQTLAESFEP